MATDVALPRNVITHTGKGTHFRLSSADWDRVLTQMVQDGQEQARHTLAKVLSDMAPSANPREDRLTLLGLLVKSELQATLIQQAIARTEITVEETTGEVEAVKDQPTTKVARTKKVREPQECLCGCGGMTGGGKWLPGHDAQRKSVLIKRVDGDADAEAAEEMVSRGWWTQERADERLAAVGTKEAAKLEKQAAKAAAAEEKARVKAEAKALAEAEAANIEEAETPEPELETEPAVV